MKKFVSNLIVLAAVSTILSSNAEPDRVGDFALLDTDGEFHQLSRYRHQGAMVVMALDDSCSSLEVSLNQFEQLHSQFKDQQASFFLINSSAQVSTESLQLLSEKASALGLPLLIDDGQLVSEAISFSKSGELVILDPNGLTILYRGAGGEMASSTLAKHLTGKIDHTVLTNQEGCDLKYPAREEHANKIPDYGAEIAPIIAKQCASCHREGGIGPFAMDSHLMVQGWSPMIKEVLLTKRMPPMQVDPKIGHFTNARYIPDEDLQKLVHWIDSGAPRGFSQTDPLTQLEFSDRREWQLGEPDYIITAPRHEVPATGVLDYLNVDVDLPFNEDKWVRAVQYIPGDESVLHHLLTYVTAPDEEVQGEAATVNVATRFLEGYAPGKVDAMTFPENTGVYIPSGYKLSMQFHYTTNGRATSDQTILGLYMYDQPPIYENFTQSVSGLFRIPPYARDHKASAQYVFNEDVTITGLRAHMHFRGKHMKFSAEYPDGTISDLLNVPNYSYAWQPTYDLEEPILLPAGTKVHVDGAFDNSENNPANPDPSKELTFGLQSWDEMFIGYWTYHHSKSRGQ
tara:strand:+ start:189 stop:1898 length:1710 start_codon:yes stop_codon:yes gene_type:complete